MKIYFLLIITIFLLIGCKKTVNIPQEISTNNDSISVESESLDNDIQKESNNEIIENSISTKITDALNEIDINLYDGIEITTEKQLEAVLAFEDYLVTQKGKIDSDRLNDLLFLDYDNDGEEEVIFEYSVILFPGTSTWGMNFLVGHIKDKKIVPIINENIGGKGWRKISFKTIDDKGVFWFDALSYEENDAMCCPSIKEVVKYEIVNGKLNMVE